MKYFRNGKMNDPLMKLYLSKDREVIIKDMLEYKKVNRQNPTYVTIDGINFHMNDIKKVEFLDGFIYDTLPDFTMHGFGILEEIINFPDTVKYIGNNCLNGGSGYFNQPLTFLKNIISIGDYFLNGFYIFNQEINLPNIEHIGNIFLGSMSEFNSPIILGDNLKSIGNGFLNNCYKFNQELRIPKSLETIGNHFISDSITFIGPLYLNKSFIDCIKNSNLDTSVGYYLILMGMENPIKIRGLSLDDFNELHELLPDRDNRVLIYDGID